METPFESAAHEVANGADAEIMAFQLVSEMTLEEKLGCLDGDTEFWSGLADMVSGGYHSHPWPAAKVPRLGIPGIDFVDGPRGSVVGPATCFPVSMARGATFDPSLEERVGEAIGKEMRAIGATYTGAVCMNLLRHPGWGRAQETYGEDPFHVGEMAAALTRGLQRHVMACMKHFALNSIEEARFRVDVKADERALHEVYLPHFRRVAKEGVASVMSAYNSVNGTWCGESQFLLTQILREEWGWDGFVTSDFIAGLHDPVASVEAGLDIEMPFMQQRHFALPAAIERGELDEDEVDQRVKDIIATLLRFAHIFDSRPDRSILACPEHRALAREVAARSMVLLRNDNGLLPVDPGSTSRIAVLGSLASIPNTGDGGSSAVFPPDVVTLLDGIRRAFPQVEVAHSDHDASIAAQVDLAVVVVGFTSADEGEFIDLSAQASMLELFPPPPSGTIAPAAASDDRTIQSQKGRPTPVAGSDAPSTLDAGVSKPSMTTDSGFSSGGDRRTLRLHEEDEELVRSVVATCRHTVVVVMGGSAAVMPWLEETPAVIFGWYPGMEGGNALGDVLTGRFEPSGRLPFAIPRDEIDLVPFDPDSSHVIYDLFHGQWKLHQDGVDAHFPFGWGLGYTTFEISQVRTPTDSPWWEGEVEVEVVNTGSRVGSTVIQVYGSKPDSAFDRPIRRLVGFGRVELLPGERRNVAIHYDLATLGIRVHGSWVFERGIWNLSIGQHADDVAFTIELDLESL